MAPVSKADGAARYSGVVSVELDNDQSHDGPIWEDSHIGSTAPQTR